MGESTAIAWCDHTFNPWRGCQRVSEGCRHCYAETLMHRWGLDNLWGPKGERRRTTPANWRKPKQWNRAAVEAEQRRRVFCSSLADVFEDHPDANAARPDLWELIDKTRWLDWLLLTKRPENIARMLPSGWGDGWPNVWLGTSIEDMRVAHRVAALVSVPAAVHFISYEPALGPLDDLDLSGIEWVIYGGESGKDFRPDDRDWARAMRDRCQRAGIAFFYKQGAALHPGRDTLLDGEEHRAWPA